MQAAELPIGVDHGVDQEAFQRRGGTELLVIAAGERFEFVRIFAGNYLKLGVDARFQRVETRNGLPLRRAGAGRFLGVATIRLDLKLRSHTFSRSEHNAGTVGNRARGYRSD